MLWVVRCTLHRHCDHCHCHYQKCQYRIRLLRCLRSNRHLILYPRARCILVQLLKIVLDTVLLVVMMVVVMVVVVVFGGFVACEAKWLHTGNDSQEVPQDDDYKCFLKNNLKKIDLI